MTELLSKNLAFNEKSEIAEENTQINGADRTTKGGGNDNPIPSLAHLKARV